MNPTVHAVARNPLFHSPIRRYLVYRYQYNFTPEQLSFLVGCLNETSPIQGSIVEIGCAVGCTTVFLNKHMDFVGMEKLYRCIDTFGGFTSDDIEYEVVHRQKTKRQLSGFQANSLAFFRYTLECNRISRVVCNASDIKTYEFPPDERVSFCLVDVDLYRPTLAALGKVWPRLQPGGMVIVDDVKDSNQFDGAYQAYLEFVQARNLPVNVVLDKLGVIRKPALTQEVGRRSEDGNE